MKKKIYQKTRNHLEGEELARVEDLILKGIYITFREQTKLSCFYRCKLCRKSTLRYDKNIEKFFKTKGHTHHCPSHKMPGPRKPRDDHKLKQSLFKISNVS